MGANALAYERKDPFYRRAKLSGYRSRAAFKLQQLAQRAHLFHRGDRVVDLGAWPGGWLQVAAEQVGPSGRVIGIDRRPIDALRAPVVTVLTGDVTDGETQDRLIQACGGPVDVLLSDLAPTLSGVRARDDAQARQLVDCVLTLAGRLLRPGGHLVVKLFTTADLSACIAELRAQFADVRTTRPEATRRGSSEIYAIAKHFRPPSKIP